MDAGERLDAVVLSIARLIGRPMAREDFEKVRSAANDNAPPVHSENQIASYHWPFLRAR